MMRSGIYFIIVIFSPLLYSFDNDSFREEEVIAVAIIATLFWLASGRQDRIGGKKSIFAIGIFSMVLLLQQLFISNGSFVFGAKYSIILICGFIPYWLGRVFCPDEKYVAFSLHLLFVITAITLFASHIFEIGEVYFQAGGLKKSFGWLGDSYSPIAVFFVLFYYFQKRYLISTLAILALLITGGKSAIFMLAMSPFLFVKAPLRIRIILLSIPILIIFGIQFLLPYDLMPLGEYSYNNRLLSLSAGVSYFQDNPIFGVGVNQSKHIIEYDTELLANSEGIGAFFPVYAIHNSFVRTAAETGIIGLLIFLGLCYLIIKESLFAIKRYKLAPNSTYRSIVMASSIWVVSFVLFYQTTGWFEAGHPQLAWLLTFSLLSYVFSHSKSPRVSRRLHFLRGWSYEQTDEMSRRGSGAGGSHGAGTTK